MPEILGFAAAVSVDAHLLAGVFLLCATAAEESRRDDDDRRERTQLRAADWQDNDMVGWRGVVLWERDGLVRFKKVVLESSRWLIFLPVRQDREIR